MQKITVTKNRENPYVMLYKEPLSDPMLSWRAKGLWAYLLSKPDGWSVYENDLISKGTEGRDAIRKAIKELESAGYVRRKRIRNDQGRLGSYEYTIYENPVENLLTKEYPVDKTP